MNAEFFPTHTVRGDGLPAWAKPDGRRDPVARLDPGLQVEVVDRSGDWANIRCSNDWMAWVDARRLVALAAPPAAQLAQPAEPAEPAQRSTEVTPSGGSVRSYADVYRRAKPDGTSPARIAAAAAAGAEPGRPSVSLPLLGALLVGIGGFLPWFSFANAPSRGAPSIPLQFLVDIHTTADGPIDLVVPLLVAAVIGAGATVLPKWARARRIAGWSVIVISSVFVGQLQRLLSEFGPGSPSLIESAGFGVLVTLIGGLILALAPETSSEETP